METTAPKYSVLLVDDDTFLLDMYSVKFREAGLDVHAAVGGEEALKALRDGFSPDAVVLDVVMPGIDGIEVLGMIKKEKLAPKAVYIILSNQGQDSDIARARELGAHGYIIKASSIPSEVLQEVIRIIHDNRV